MLNENLALIIEWARSIPTNLWVQSRGCDFNVRRVTSKTKPKREGRPGGAGRIESPIMKSRKRHPSGLFSWTARLVYAPWVFVFYCWTQRFAYIQGVKAYHSGIVTGPKTGPPNRFIPDPGQLVVVF